MTRLSATDETDFLAALLLAGFDGRQPYKGAVKAGDTPGISATAEIRRDRTWWTLTLTRMRLAGRRLVLGGTGTTKPTEARRFGHNAAVGVYVMGACGVDFA